jgi:tRNA pseudouridine32 synthase / 23S rRNA pseudouridine746 synthase
MKVQHRATIDDSTAAPLVDYLAGHTELSKIKIKKAIGAGGCWIARPHLRKGKLLRSRKIKYVLKAGDRVEFYFDDNALAYEGQMPEPLFQKKDYGLWYKPVNVLSGASRYGEVCAIDYLVRQISGKDMVHVVNRLDREAAGIVVLGYSRRGAARLSELWQGNDVEKVYQLEVLGEVEAKSGTIDTPVGGKTAHTEYEVAEHRTDENGRTTTRVIARIRTGRFHQIREHFSKIGHPVLGDPKYGQGNSHPDGLQLVSTEVHFVCPFSKKQIDMVLPRELRLW